MIKTIPKIQKKVNAFLVGEDGKISKKNIMTASLLLSGVAATILNSDPANAEIIYTKSLVDEEGCVKHSSHGEHSIHVNY